MSERYGTIQLKYHSKRATLYENQKEKRQKTSDGGTRAIEQNFFCQALKIQINPIYLQEIPIRLVERATPLSFPFFLAQAVPQQNLALRLVPRPPAKTNVSDPLPLIPSVVMGAQTRCGALHCSSQIRVRRKRKDPPSGVQAAVVRTFGKNKSNEDQRTHLFPGCYFYDTTRRHRFYPPPRTHPRKPPKKKKETKRK
jgi:hypothetical protein